MYILCIYWQHLKEKVQLMESSNASFLPEECAHFCTSCAEGHEWRSDWTLASKGLFISFASDFLSSTEQLPK